MNKLSATILLSALIALAGCAKSNSSDETDFMSDDPTASADTAPVDDTSLAADAATTSTDSVAADPAPVDAPIDNSVIEPVAANPVTESTAPAMLSDGTGTIENYTVQKGDTLMKVAFNIYGNIDSWKSIYQLNRETISNAKSLRVGQVIKYDKPANAPSISQNGEPFMIRQGDTLGIISEEVYATPRKWRALFENNRQLIKDPNKIYVGFYLYYQMTEEDKRMAESRRGSRKAASLPVVKQDALSPVPAMNSAAAPVETPAVDAPAPVTVTQ